jgi:hypothetical protein
MHQIVSGIIKDSITTKFIPTKQKQFITTKERVNIKRVEKDVHNCGKNARNEAVILDEKTHTRKGV